MNHPHDHDLNQVEQDEWEAQERALLAERLHLSDTRDDTRSQSYRRLMRALRKPQATQLPADFARQMADQVRRDARGSTDSVIANYLARGLLAVLLLCSVGLAYSHGGTWWTGLAHWLPPAALTNPWLLALASCTLVSALLDTNRWRTWFASDV